MATITSRLGALIDYLVTTFTAASTLGASTSAPVQIFDGPVTTMADGPLKLYVGLADPDNTGPEEAGTIAQQWAALGRLGRDEESVIRCCAEAWNGTSDVQSARQAANGIVAAVEVIMQNDTTGFGGNVLFPNPGITSGTLVQGNADPGVLARIQFDITFKSRIGGF